MNQKLHTVILDAATIAPEEELRRFEAFGTLTIHDATRRERVLSRIEDADVIITNKVVIGQAAMDAAVKLKLICVTATGTNNIDLDYAGRKGIAVKNVAGYAAESVAQFTFAAILHLIHRLDREDAFIRSGHYFQSGLFTHFYGQSFEIKGKTLGIVGLGSIGRRVAEIGEAFGARVIYHSTSGRNTGQPYERFALDGLLRAADLISINAPLNEATKGLIGTEQLRACKASAILVNTGRGGIVDERALAEALDEGELGAAALDVFEEEPLPPESPLLKLQNPERMLLSPHNAWSSQEARAELVARTHQNVAEFFKGS